MSSGPAALFHVPSETTPLISHSSPHPKRVRSYTNTFGFLPKRRIRAKCKPFDKARINIVKDYVSEEDTHYDSSPTIRTPSNTYRDDIATWQSLVGDAELEPEKPHFPSPSSRISLTLENSGSVARDHLASERTFLAYVRTSLALASSGVALVQLFTVAASRNLPSPSGHRLHVYIRPLGAATTAMGLIVLMIGVNRYFSVQAALTKGTFPVARLFAAAIALALTLLVVLTFGILLAGKLEPRAVLA